jgi:hypothetical protein
MKGGLDDLSGEFDAMEGSKGRRQSVEAGSGNVFKPDSRRTAQKDPVRLKKPWFVSPHVRIFRS